MTGLIVAVQAGVTFDLLGSSSSAGQMQSGALMSVQYMGPPMAAS